MKSLSLRNVTFLSSLAITIFFIILISILNTVEFVAISLYQTGVLSSLLFVGSAIVFYSFLSGFIFRRINHLKYTISTFRKYNIARENPLPEEINSGNEVEGLYKEVMDWAEDRKNEIEKLQKLELYRKEFLGNVSHELKTPVFNIQGYIATLLDGGLEDKTINKEYLMRAEKSVDRMISMIGDLEAITRLETGQLELEQEKFDVVALMKDVFEAEEMKSTGKGIILRLKEGNEKPFYVIADKFRIRQVITNLVVNSIHYGKEYGETIARFYNDGDTTVVEIADNGPGIAKEHLPRLFERFYRVDKGRSRSQGGTGLGLSIVKHILEAHGQSISVNSKPGAGSVFSFTLKRARE